MGSEYDCLDQAVSRFSCGQGAWPFTTVLSPVVVREGGHVLCPADEHEGCRKVSQLLPNQRRACSLFLLGADEPRQGHEA